MGQGIFVGRQPIMDRDQQVVAYELLFRNSRTAQAAIFAESGTAVVRVIVNTFTSLGMDAVLGRAKGFFNVNREVLLSDLLEALPRERVVIELLEDIEPDDEVVARCRELREAGFEIALDDWVVDDPREVLLPHASIVKVDLPAIPPDALRRLVRHLRRSGALLLAEKVETPEEFTTCHALGFDRFQGFFFAKPVVLEGADLDVSKSTLIKLLQQITTGAETREIVDSFKQDPELGLNLLRLVNTAGMAVRVRLETIEDAVRHLGLVQLGRWVAILLYANGDAHGLRSPLLMCAAHRGRLMELLVGVSVQGGDASEARERAFLVGMLSLADALFGRSIEDLVRELRLAPELARALTLREGELGRLLSWAESVERGEFEKVESALDRSGVDLDTLQHVEHQAYAWVHGLTQAALV